MRRYLTVLMVALAAALLTAPATVPVLAEDQQEAAAAGIGPIGIVTRIARDAKAVRGQQVMRSSPAIPSRTPTA